MNRDEIKDLLRQIKVFYPRFDNVEKAPGNMYQISGVVIESWYDRIGWMELDQAQNILNRYMEAENGNKTPNISLWLSGGKQYRASAEVTAFYDRRTGTVVWEPEEGHRFELKGEWNKGTFEDEDGRRWAFAED